MLSNSKQSGKGISYRIVLFNSSEFPRVRSATRNICRRTIVVGLG